MGIRSLMFFIVLLSIFYSKTAVCGDFNPESQAQSIFSLYSSQTEDADALRENFINPLLGKGKLYNLERSRSFTASISCPASSKFLEIIMHPEDTGDVSFYVNWDSNFDGSMDRSSLFSSISGICSNGFIRCDPGTWQNCRYYKVVYDGSLVEMETQRSRLSACFCINNSCGSNLAVKNKEYVLKTFGGVVVSAFHEYDPHYAVSQTDLSDMVVRYYGQSLAECSFPSDFSEGVKRPEIYYDNPYQMKADAQSIQAESSFTDMFTNLINQQTEKVCYTKRVITEVKYDLTDVLASSEAQNCPGINPGPGVCGTNCLKFTMPIYIHYGGSYRSTLTFDLNKEFIEKITDTISFVWCTQTTGPYPCTDDDGWFVFYVNGIRVASGSYGDSEDCGNAPNGGCWHRVDISTSYFHEGSNSVVVVIGGAGGGEGVQAGCRIINVYFRFNSPLKGCYIDQNYIDDTCEALANNPDCILKDKIVDGVYVLKDRTATGLFPVTECRTICEDTFCYDWWTIERHYICSEPDISMENLGKRPEEIISTLSYDGNQAGFNDIRKENESWVSYPDQKLNFTLKQGEDCEQVCKVKVPIDKTEVGERGPVVHFRTQGTAYRYDYRECRNNKCPYDPSKGEEVVAPCSCISLFPEAAAALQAVRLAGQDITCTTGVKKSLPGY